jgi:ATP-dependent protease Clp ATPase subunit
MIAHLDRFVRGQARAKQDIAVAVYNHDLSQAYREREGAISGATTSCSSGRRAWGRPTS